MNFSHSMWKSEECFRLVNVYFFSFIFASFNNETTMYINFQEGSAFIRELKERYSQEQKGT